MKAVYYRQQSSYLRCGAELHSVTPDPAFLKLVDGNEQADDSFLLSVLVVHL